jgi:hypothetical protein
MRATIRHLRTKLTETRAELALVRDVIRAARAYIRTGDDGRLRASMAAVGFEEPPHRTEPDAQPVTSAVSEGRPFEPCENFELL